MKLFEMVAMGKEIHAYHEVYKQDADRYCAELDRLQKYLETADIPEVNVSRKLSTLRMQLEFSTNHLPLRTDISK